MNSTLALVGLILAGIVFAMSFLGLSPVLIIGGFHLQLLELVQLFPLVWLLFIFRRLAKARITIALAVVFLANTVPLVEGLLQNEMANTLRDFAGVYYMSIVLFGYALGRFNILSAENLVVGFALAGVVFISGYFLVIGSSVIDYETMQYHFRVPGIACFLCAVMCAAGFSSLKGFRRIIILVGGLFYGVFILQLRTRAAHLAILAGVLVIITQLAIHYYRNPGNISQIVWRLLAGFTLLFIFLAPNLDKISTLSANVVERTDYMLSSLYYTDVTIGYRLEAWGLAWDEFLSSPFFGVGFGRYLILDPWVNGEYALYPAHMIHNGLLQILYSGGVVALAGFAYFWWSVRKEIGMNIVKNRTMPALSLTLAFAIYVSFGATLFNTVEAIPLWTILGMAIGENERLDADRKRVSRSMGNHLQSV